MFNFGEIRMGKFCKALKDNWNFSNLFIPADGKQGILIGENKTGKIKVYFNLNNNSDWKRGVLENIEVLKGDIEE